MLQSHTIFSNVGKGTLAKSADLIAVFGTDDEEVVCREVRNYCRLARVCGLCCAVLGSLAMARLMLHFCLSQILDHGEYQVSDLERQSAAANALRDITAMVAARTVNPATQRPYSVTIVDKFIRELHFSVDPNKSTKQQALELIRRLSAKFPIVRARMELRVTLPQSNLPALREKLGALSEGAAVVQGEAMNLPDSGEKSLVNIVVMQITHSHCLLLCMAEGRCLRNMSYHPVKSTT